MNRVKKLLIILLAATVAIVAGCTSGKPKEKALHKIKVSEVVHSIFYAPHVVAKYMGFWEEEGLDVELMTILGADKGAAALLSGEVDFALFGPEAAVYINQQGAAQPIKAFAQLTAKDGSFLVGRTAEPDFQWTDTKGKVIIGGRPGGMPQMVLEYVLNEHGVTPQTDVEIIQNLALDATMGAFKSGTGDYVQLWEPGPTTLEKEGAGHVVAPMGHYSGPVPYTVFHATEKTLKERPEITQAFTNGLYKAMLWVDSHSAEELAEMVAPEYTGIDKEVLAIAFQRYKEMGAWSSTPVLTEEAYEHLIRVISAAGELTGEAPPYELVVNTEYAKKAVEQVKP